MENLAEKIANLQKDINEIKASCATKKIVKCQILFRILHIKKYVKKKNNKTFKSWPFAAT